jgi:carbonic anhydrase
MENTSPWQMILPQLLTGTRLNRMLRSRSFLLFPGAGRGRLDGGRLMTTLSRLLENNRNWASGISETDPSFFPTLAQQQSPELLWIGCSDSRVPANQITGLLPGELFVHRNVANLVNHTDMNCLSVLQYAVEILRIKHIIVCGHYGCGGVKAALDSESHGLVDNWLRQIRDIHQRRDSELLILTSEEKRINRLCELNVIEQVKNVGETTIVQEAWQRQQMVSIHGWIYSISNGLLMDLNANVSSSAELELLESR